MTWRPWGNQGPPPKEVRRTSNVDPGYLPTRWELRDFALSYVLLSLAFGIFFNGGASELSVTIRLLPEFTAFVFLLSFLTAGIGFVLHELAHRMVAIRFGHAAAFRAHYGMLVLGIATALGGLIFGAPGGVHHRRDVPTADVGKIALAGPVTNLVLGVLFSIGLVATVLVGPTSTVWLGGFDTSLGALVGAVCLFGAAINFILAGLNMLPVGPLDGGKVYLWSSRVYLAVAIPSVVLGVISYLVVFAI